MLFRPCIDLHDGKVKQIVGSTLSDAGAEENFVSDRPPSYYAELYKKDGLKGGHIIKLGTNNDEAAISGLNAYPNGMQVGGGINLDNALFWLEVGATHIILTSFIFSNGKINLDNLKKITDLVGRERLVLDLSCRFKDGKYYVVTDRWQKFTDYIVEYETLNFLSDYCDEFLIHAVDVEGMQSGVDKRLIELIASNSPIPTTYAGGISSLEDIDTVIKSGDNKMFYTVGSALDIFGGKKLKYNDVINYEMR